MSFLISYCPLFWGSRAVYNDLKTRYMFESYDQKLVVFLFFGHFHELFPHSFWVPSGFARPVRPVTCLRDMTKSSLFPCFMAVFMSYCPLFWGSRAIYNDLKTRYMLERYDPKLVVFVVFGHFHELFPIVFGFQAELQGM